jgi:hypothetical protein
VVVAIVVMIAVTVVAIPIPIVVPPALRAIPPDVIGAITVLTFFVQRVTTTPRLRASLAVFTDSPIQPSFCFLDAMLALLPIIRLGARRADQNEGGTEKGCAYHGARSET